jgi:hypothetical protein
MTQLLAEAGLGEGPLLWRARAAILGGSGSGRGGSQEVAAMAAAKRELGDCISYGQLKVGAHAQGGGAKGRAAAEGAGLPPRGAGRQGLPAAERGALGQASSAPHPPPPPRAPQVIAAALALGMLPGSLAEVAGVRPALAAAGGGGGAPRQAPVPSQAQGPTQQQDGDGEGRALTAAAGDGGGSSASGWQPGPLPPHLARALQAPSATALEVHRRWLSGLPLAHAGAVGGGIDIGVRAGAEGEGWSAPAPAGGLRARAWYQGTYAAVFVSGVGSAHPIPNAVTRLRARPSLPFPPAPSAPSAAGAAAAAPGAGIPRRRVRGARPRRRQPRAARKRR